MQNGATSPTVSRRDILICAALAIVTLALYWPVTGFEFNNYDDAQYITKNPAVQQGLTGRTVAWAFTSGYAGNWHPLTWLSHMLDWQIFGPKAGGHHFINLLFHIANTLLLFGLLRRLTGATWRPAIVAALFAWHPTHVESVAWVAERKDVLSAFFAFLTIWVWCTYVKAPSWKRYGLALLFFALGLMAKPMLVTLPIVLLLLDFWPLCRFDLSKKSISACVPLFREKIPFFALTLISCLVTFRVQKAGGAMYLTHLSLADRISNALNSYVGYLGKLFWPQDLAILYPHTASIPMGQVIGAAIVLLLMTALAVWFIRSRPWLAVGWSWFIIMLVPVIGIVQVGEQALADRYTYLPAIGIFIIVLWGAAELAGRWQGAQVLSRAAAGVALVACLVVAWFQIATWKNSVTLFTRALAVTKNNAVAHCNLGAALATEGKTTEALAEFDKALRLRPDYPQALINKGSLLSEQGRVDDAIANFNEALISSPDWHLAHLNLGLALFKQERFDEAIVHFRSAAKSNPADAQAPANLGLALARQGKMDEAIAEYRKALQIAPNAYAENALGGALEMQNKPDEAIQHYRAAVRIKPDFAEARNNLGALLNLQGKFADAREHLAAAIKAKPEYGEAHGNLGNSLLGSGQYAEAKAQYIEAVRLQTNNLDGHFNLATLMARDQLWDAAVRHYTESLRIKADFVEAHLGIAQALAKLGDGKSANEHYRTALQLNPRETRAMRKLAWMLATQPDATLRNGAEALRLSNLANQTAPMADAASWDTHAAACAEAGQFGEAVNAAKKALELATAPQQKDLTTQIQSRLQLYESGRAFRESAGQR